ncbi:hypothetical protein [Beduinella massiliensis]|uniref:hypothetical protein n=1 Tax=Beduinella massiliensis TaxID=1852363 RepID=UPI0031F8AEE0
MNVGTVTTGAPGSDVQVTNSGDENNAVLDFVIPRGDPGGGGTPEVLATVDTATQASSAGGALVFNDTPLVSGTTISHTAGSSNVVINQPGIYQATFHGTASVDAGTPIPAELTVHLNLDGTPISGAVAHHTYTASTEVATLPMSVPFEVTTTPANLEVVADQAGFTFFDISFTVARLGD